MPYGIFCMLASETRAARELHRECSNGRDGREAWQVVGSVFYTIEMQFK
jgi:hypothetical protein